MNLNMFKLFVKIVITILFTCFLVISGFIDISFADELTPVESTNISPEVKRPPMFLETVGFYLYTYRYYIISTIVISFILLSSAQAIVDKPFGEKELLLLKDLPNPHFQSFQQALYMCPELQGTTNSPLLPDLIEAQLTLRSQSQATPDGL